LVATRIQLAEHSLVIEWILGGTPVVDGVDQGSSFPLSWGAELYSSNGKTYYPGVRDNGAGPVPQNFYNGGTASDPAPLAGTSASENGNVVTLTVDLKKIDFPLLPFRWESEAVAEFPNQVGNLSGFAQTDCPEPGGTTVAVPRHSSGSESATTIAAPTTTQPPPSAIATTTPTTVPPNCQLSFANGPGSSFGSGTVGSTSTIQFVTRSTGTTPCFLEAMYPKLGLPDQSIAVYNGLKYAGTPVAITLYPGQSAGWSITFTISLNCGIQSNITLGIETTGGLVEGSLPLEANTCGPIFVSQLVAGA
jgi:hypothetical protein